MQRLLIGATLLRCSLCDDTTIEAVSAIGIPSPLVLSQFESLNAIRASGTSCPGGLHFRPDPVPLKFDCGLWRAAESKLRQKARARYSLPPSAQRQQLLRFAQGNSSNLVSVEGTRAWLKTSDDDCRKLMDPAVRVLGIAHHSTSQTGKQQHIWLHTIGPAKVLGDSSCLSEPQVAHKDSSRRLKPSGGGSDASTEVSKPEEEEVYEGPGQTFGMILLIVSVSLFCTCTFGSIIIGNWILSKNPAEQSGDPEPVP